MVEALGRVTAGIGRPRVSLMHVCGSHEQAIAKYGLRASFPAALSVIMGPGCPVCVTDAREVDEGVALALQGVHIATYGDMLRVPGSVMSLADAQAEGAKIHVIYSAGQAVELAERLEEPVVFFATGFETTAVATAAIVLKGLPDNLSILSAHKYIPPAMDVVAATPGLAVEGFLAAGHAATITGWGVFEAFVGAPSAAGGRRRFRTARHPGRARAAPRTRPRRHAGGRQHVSPVRDQGRQSPRAGRAVGGVRALQRALARHRASSRTATSRCAAGSPPWTRGRDSPSTSPPSRATPRPNWPRPVSAAAS